MNKFKKVTKDQFTVFVSDYPKALLCDICGIGEPPIQSYNDFSEGKIWPESIVARIKLHWLGPNGETDLKTNQFFEYYIKDDI